MPSAHPTVDAGSPDLRDECLKLLNQHPYFLVVTGRAPEDSPDFTQSLVTELSGDPAHAEKMTLSRIELNPEKAASKQGATSFSRTSQALEAHTDSSFFPRPHEIVAFQFVRVDPEGGDSIMVPLDEVTERLDPKARKAAADTAFSFGDQAYPFLTEADGRTSLRFYRTQIEKSAGGPLTGERLELVDAMSAAVSADHEDYRFHAEPGEIVLINNTKTLHSRTGFGDHSDRLMFRVRCNSDLVK